MGVDLQHVHCAARDGAGDDAVNNDNHVADDDHNAGSDDSRYNDSRSDNGRSDNGRSDDAHNASPDDDAHNAASDNDHNAASGDDDLFDNKAEGFDTILDNPNATNGQRVAAVVQVNDALHRQALILHIAGR